MNWMLCENDESSPAQSFVLNEDVPNQREKNNNKQNQRKKNDHQPTYTEQLNKLISSSCRRFCILPLWVCMWFSFTIISPFEFNHFAVASSFVRSLCLVCLCSANCWCGWHGSNPCIVYILCGWCIRLFVVVWCCCIICSFSAFFKICVVLMFFGFPLLLFWYCASFIAGKSNHLTGKATSTIIPRKPTTI